MFQGLRVQNKCVYQVDHCEKAVFRGLVSTSHVKPVIIGLMGFWLAEKPEKARNSVLHQSSQKIQFFENRVESISVPKPQAWNRVDSIFAEKQLSDCLKAKGSLNHGPGAKNRSKKRTYRSLTVSNETCLNCPPQSAQWLLDCQKLFAAQTKLRESKRLASKLTEKLCFQAKSRFAAKLSVFRF